MKAAQLLIFCGMFLLTSCVGYLPKPTLHERYGRPVTRALVKFIQPGRTTRAEVVASLGTEYASLPQDRALAYPWETSGLSFEWYWVLTGFTHIDCEKTDVETSPMGARWQAYFVAFDDQAVVRATGFRKLTTNKPLSEQLETWCNQLPAPKK